MTILGFAEGAFPPGTHICQIYSDDGERDEALVAFLRAGLSCDEKAASFSEHVDLAGLARALGEIGVDIEQAIERGELTLAGTSEVYFEGGRFEPDAMLEKLRAFHQDAMAKGHTECRVIGEMTPEIQTIHGGGRLLEYESRVTQLLEECPVTAVCQYDAREFDGATILEVLKVHPMMVVGGKVIHNPFFIPPVEFFA